MYQAVQSFLGHPGIQVYQSVPSESDWLNSMDTTIRTRTRVESSWDIPSMYSSQRSML